MAVTVDLDEKSAKVVVPDNQLSLAIGKEGQNARLAARLTGYKIDIKSESQVEEAEPDYEDEEFEEYEEYDEFADVDEAENDEEPVETDDYEAEDLADEE